MRKVLTVALCAAAGMSLAACGSSQTGSTSAGAAETLTGTAEGFGGDVTVTLTVEDGAITACTITGDDETPDIGGAALEEL